MSELIDVTGRLRKMPAEAGNPVAYSIAVGDTRIPLNDLIGRPLRLDFDGVIRCIHCDRKTNKSFNQGFCYPCFRKLAACDSCIMSPEKCHYHLGTCREPEWGEAHCMVEHVVYLANSSGLKVGITRASQVPTRWIDQGLLTLYRWCALQRDTSQALWKLPVRLTSPIGPTGGPCSRAMSRNSIWWVSGSGCLG